MNKTALIRDFSNYLDEDMLDTKQKYMLYHKSDPKYVLNYACRICISCSIISKFTRTVFDDNRILPEYVKNPFFDMEKKYSPHANVDSFKTIHRKQSILLSRFEEIYNFCKESDILDNDLENKIILLIKLSRVYLKHLNKFMNK